jgi:succinate dehydrogenase / fumarate reductase membrane anchor subunit
MANKTPSMRTPMGRVRYLGSAKSGTTEFTRQRLTAYALLPLSLAFVILILSLVGKDYDTVRTTLGRPFPAVLILLFLLAGVWHMHIGMKVIIEDYIHDHAAKKLWLIANLFFCFAIGAACAFSVLRLSFV